MTEQKRGYQPQNELSEEGKERIRTTLQFVVLGSSAIFGQAEIIQQVAQASQGLTLEQIQNNVISDLAKKDNVSVEEMLKRVGIFLTGEVDYLEVSGILSQTQNTTEEEIPTFQLSPYAKEYWDSIKDDPDKAARESIFPLVTLTHFLK